jgi:hypothetical protein
MVEGGNCKVMLCRYYKSKLELVETLNTLHLENMTPETI